MKQVINIIGLSFLGFFLAYFFIMSTFFLLIDVLLENNFDSIIFYYWAITVILGFIFAFWIKKMITFTIRNNKL